MKITDINIKELARRIIIFCGLVGLAFMWADQIITPKLPIDFWRYWERASIILICAEKII